MSSAPFRVTSRFTVQSFYALLYSTYSAVHVCTFLHDLFRVAESLEAFCGGV